MKLAAGTNSSVVVQTCQICDEPALEPVLFLGFLPPVNTMPPVGTRPAEQPAYPAQVLQCLRCKLVQLGLVVDPAILFPPSYPYTSGTTRILRENFAELYTEVRSMFELGPRDLVVDIGSNDGTLLGNFHRGGHRVLGVEPTDAGKIAVANGVATLTAFFGPAVAERVVAERGRARVVTAANVFAHIEDVHSIVNAVSSMLSDDGVFVTESHYLHALLETLQYDTIYHEHLRYYSLTSLRALFAMHDLELIHAKRIPTHGGSIRVYAARKGVHKVRPSVAAILTQEQELGPAAIKAFRSGVVNSKLGLMELLAGIKRAGGSIFGVGAPSRATTLVNHVGLDDNILDCVVEIRGSYKIGKYMPGTLIPVVDESRLWERQPEFALLLSWHIADELMPKLTANGFRGDFIIPLPHPRIVKGAR
jgi:hypothetical protein